MVQVNTRSPSEAALLGVFCDEVDGCFREVKEKGATIKYPPSDSSYGMRRVHGGGFGRTSPCIWL